MNIVAALRTIAKRWPELSSSSTEAPVFVLAGAWRSGSTLLQRMLMRECLVWGEPFGRGMPIDLMAQQLRIFTDQWPADGMFVDRRKPEPGNLGREWVANLFPPLAALLQAHAAYFTALFAEPARQLGFQRWGLKEVRLGVEHGYYLKWVFPKARLLFLCRDPYACYRSFKALKLTYRRWPEEPIDAPESFGKLWNSLVSGYLDHGPQAGGLLIKYEDLCRPDFNAGQVNDYLGFALDLTARESKIGGSGKQQLTADEIGRLEALVGATAARLGYARPFE